MSVEKGRREYERQNKPAKVKTLDDLRDAKPGTMDFAELEYLAQKGDWEAASLVRAALIDRDAKPKPIENQSNPFDLQGGGPALLDNVGPNAA